MKKRKSSIGRKMVLILGILGFITLMMCVLNLMAYDVLDGYNQSLVECIEEYEKLTDGVAGTDEIVAEMDYALQKIETKISGTYIFDIILVIL